MCKLAFSRAVTNRSVACKRTLVGLLSAVVALSGCAAETERGSYFRTAQTEVRMESTPPGSIFVDNRLVGNSPTTFSIDYQQEVQRNVEKVTYWETQPELALAISILSLGLYLPFSMIPVDQKTDLIPTNSFRNNHFHIAVNAPGYEEWSKDVTAMGEQRIDFEPQLVKKSPN